MRECAISECGSQHYARGWCERHYKKWLTHGDPLIGATHYKTPLESLEARVNKTCPNGCWIWSGGRTNCGYGRLKFRGNKVLAHRFAFEQFVETIPHGMLVLHKCDNPPCCNPDHLFLGTCQDNVDDMMRKNRHVAPRGEAASKAKLTDDKVAEIFQLSRGGMLTSELAERFGVIGGTIRRVLTRKTWRHVEVPDA